MTTRTILAAAALSLATALTAGGSLAAAEPNSAQAQARGARSGSALHCRYHTVRQAQRIQTKTGTVTVVTTRQVRYCTPRRG